MLVKIKNKQARMLGLCTGHKLMPGRNAQELELTDAQLKTLLEDKTFRAWQKLGMVVLVQEEAKGRFAKPEEPSAADALGEVNVSEARVMISATSNLDLLLSWHAKEERKTVIKAIEARVDELDVSSGGEAADADADADADEGPED